MENRAITGENEPKPSQLHLFLAHLAQSAKVRYWGGPVSVVVCRASCVVNNYINIFSSETTGQNSTLHQKHPWGRETNDTERNFDSIIILVSMATEIKKLEKDLKIFSFKTNDQILKKLQKKHHWDKGNKQYETEF